MHLLSQLDFSGTDATTRWGAIVVGILTLLWVAFIRPLRKSKKKDPLDRPANASALSQQRALERDMSNLLVEYEQMIRQMTAGLDTRAAKLELLIRDAEAATAALAGAIAASAGATPHASASASTTSDGESSTPATLTEAKASSAALALPDHRPDPRYADVYDLADEGHPPREIARRLGRPHGEVELILALRAEAR